MEGTPFGPGEVVERALDNLWFAVRVVSVDADGTYTIQYMDDDANIESDVEASELRALSTRSTRTPATAAAHASKPGRRLAPSVRRHGCHVGVVFLVSWLWICMWGQCWHAAAGCDGCRSGHRIVAVVVVVVGTPRRYRVSDVCWWWWCCCCVFPGRRESSVLSASTRQRCHTARAACTRAWSRPWSATRGVHRSHDDVGWAISTPATTHAATTVRYASNVPSHVRQEGAVEDIQPAREAAAWAACVPCEQGVVRQLVVVGWAGLHTCTPAASARAHQ